MSLKVLDFPYRLRFWTHYFQSKYTPFITIPSLGENDQTDDYYYDEEENSNVDYLESRPAEYVAPPSFSIENQRPQKVTVRVENYIPLSEDTAQVRHFVLCLTKIYFTISLPFVD